MLAWIWMAVIAILAIVSLRLRTTKNFLLAALVCFTAAVAAASYVPYIWLSPEAIPSLSWIHVQFVIVFIIIEVFILGVFLLTLKNIYDERENLLAEIKFHTEEKESARKEITNLKEEIIQLKFG